MPQIPMGKFATVLLAVLFLVASRQAFAEGNAPPLPTVAPFDAGALVDAEPDAGPLGWRYAALTAREGRSIRRSFKLPLEALAKARSVAALRQAARVAKAPDLGRPILAVAPRGDESSSDPFGGRSLTSFRSNPMKALGERLGGAGDQPLAEGGDEALTAADTFTASVSADEDPFADDPADSGDAGAADGADPFASEDDPFEDGEDPFGF